MQCYSKGHEPPLCKPIEKVIPLEYINMEVEDAFEVEYSIEELVQLVQDLIPWKKTH
jgi:hypothetical protein